MEKDLSPAVERLCKIIDVVGKTSFIKWDVWKNKIAKHIAKPT